VGSGVALGQLEVPAPHGIAEVAASLAVDQAAVQPAVAALAARCAAVGQAADGGHGDVGDHDRAFGRAGLKVLAHVPASAGLAGGPVDLHALPVEADVADRHGNGFLPAQAGESQDHRHIPQASLEQVERLGEPEHLRDARDDHPAADRSAPAGAQFERGVDRDDPLLPRPGEQSPQHRRHRALGAAGRRGAVLQRQVADGRVQFGQVQVADPGLAERGEDVDVQAGPLLGQR
jgi:hypothetical protein